MAQPVDGIATTLHKSNCSKVATPCTCGRPDSERRAIAGLLQRPFVTGPMKTLLCANPQCRVEAFAPITDIVCGGTQKCPACYGAGL